MHPQYGADRSPRSQASYHGGTPTATLKSTAYDRFGNLPSEDDDEDYEAMTNTMTSMASMALSARSVNTTAPVASTGQKKSAAAFAHDPDDYMNIPKVVGRSGRAPSTAATRVARSADGEAVYQNYAEEGPYQNEFGAAHIVLHQVIKSAPCCVTAHYFGLLL